MTGSFVKQDPAQQARLMKKYADFASSLNMKSYIRDIRNPETFRLAVEAKFSYIAGAAILPEQKTCFLTQKLSLPR